MDPALFLETWLKGTKLRPSTQEEYTREVKSWLAWCAAQRGPRVNPYSVGPEHVARWSYEAFLAPYLDDHPFDGPDDLAYLAAEHPAVTRSHDRRISIIVQYYKAATARGLVLDAPHLHDLRSDLNRANAPRRLNPRERHAFITAVATWGPDNSQHHQRDQLVAYLLLEGLRPAQIIRLDWRLMDERPDHGYECRNPDGTDGPGRRHSLDPLTGAAVKAYLPHRPTPKPGVDTLLLSRTGRPLYRQFPNELVDALSGTHPLLAHRYPPVTADIVAHTGLWDAPEPAPEAGKNP